MQTTFEELKGCSITAIKGCEEESDRIDFITDKGNYALAHIPDCCETVRLIDVVGDVADLIGNPILIAEEAYFIDEDPEGVPVAGCESWTWVFYKLSTIKGSVTLRWLGESNGYYGESACFFAT